MKKKVIKNSAATDLEKDSQTLVDKKKNVTKAETQADVSDVATSIAAPVSEVKKVAKTSEKSEIEAQDIQHEEEKKCEPKVLLLEGDLGIAQVETLHKTWLAMLESASEIKMDAGGLNQVDTAGTQLIYAVIQDAKSRKLDVSWKSASQALRKSSEQLGLSDLMAL